MKTDSKNEARQADGPTTPAPIEIVLVDGNEVQAVQDPAAGDCAGVVWVIVKRVCEALGLDEEPQRKKLKGKAWATTSMKEVVAEDGKTRVMFCISLRSLPLWLATIEASRVAEAVRPKLEVFQLRCHDALADHFFGRPAEPAEPPPPAFTPLPPIVGGLPSGVIGRARAAAYVLGPLRELARLTAELVGVERDDKRARRQMASCHKQVNDELRVRLGYPLAAALRWEMLTEQGLGQAMQHLWHMHARIVGQLRSRGDRGVRPRQGRLAFGEGLAQLQKDALKRDLN